jgi:5-methylcytosine-specific restriction endonuclease McrA
MKTINTKCLVLNADYTPLAVISWKRAISWLYRSQEESKMGIEIIDFYRDDHIIGANGKYHPIPAVVKTKKFFRMKNSKVKFSRKNIFIRDDFTCQYCGQKGTFEELTYDHVIPKSKWDSDKKSPTTWTNIVTACKRCNIMKDDRTPKQANMPLKNLPSIPDKHIKYLPVSSHLRNIDRLPEEWKIYLPESYY